MFVYSDISVAVRVMFTVLLLLILAPLALSQEQVTAPAGSRLVVAPTSTLRTGDTESSDQFSALLVTDLAVDGKLAAMRGDMVTGTVVSAKKARRVAGKAELELRLDSIHTGGRSFPFMSIVWGVEGEKSKELRKMAAKAALGKVIGGAAMAKRMVATSSALAVITPGEQIEVTEGSLMEFYLAEPITLPLMANVGYTDKDTALSVFQRVMNENLKLQMEYGWTREVTVAKDGDVKSNDRARVRYDSLGDLMEEPIGEQDEGGRGVRGRMKKKKLKKMDELVAGIHKLLAAYSLAAPELSQKFFTGAVASHASGDLAGMIQFESVDVISLNDWTAVWFDASTMSPRKLLFKTFMEEKVVQGQVTYLAIDGNTFQIGEANVRIPGDGLAVTITNADFYKTQ
jgi:hypothetical protein